MRVGACRVDLHRLGKLLNRCGDLVRLDKNSADSRMRHRLIGIDGERELEFLSLLPAFSPCFSKIMPMLLCASNAFGSMASTWRYSWHGFIKFVLRAESIGKKEPRRMKIQGHTASVLLL